MALTNRSLPPLGVSALAVAVFFIVIQYFYFVFSFLYAAFSRIADAVDSSQSVVSGGRAAWRWTGGG